MRDKDGNYAVISFDVKTINKKILPVLLVKCRQLLGSMIIKVLLQVIVFIHSEFKFPFVITGTQSKAKNLPSKFDLFLGSLYGLELTQGDKEMEFLIHIAQCRFQVLLWHSINC